jgi:putative DNA primase/helicase
MVAAMRELIEHLASLGYQPPEYLEPGKFHRFPAPGKGRSNRAGWVKLFEDLKGAVYGDLSQGVAEAWEPGNAHHGAPLSADETAQARRTREQAQWMRWNEAATRARRIWRATRAAPRDHRYLTTKGIPPMGARASGDALVMPITDLAGRIWSLQFISPSGAKRMLKGGRKKGCHISLADIPAHPPKVYICEGWATGVTIATDLHPGEHVLAAVDAGNMRPVALAVRERWPDVEIVIAADDDRTTAGNPGVGAALDAALAVSGRVIKPNWPKDAPLDLSDFNDWVRWKRCAKGEGAH